MVDRLQGSPASCNSPRSVVVMRHSVPDLDRRCAAVRSVTWREILQTGVRAPGATATHGPARVETTGRAVRRDPAGSREPTRPPITAPAGPKSRAGASPPTARTDAAGPELRNVPPRAGRPRRRKRPGDGEASPERERGSSQRIRPSRSVETMQAKLRDDLTLGRARKFGSSRRSTRPKAKPRQVTRRRGPRNPQDSAFVRPRARSSRKRSSPSWRDRWDGIGGQRSPTGCPWPPTPTAEIVTRRPFASPGRSWTKFPNRPRPGSSTGSFVTGWAGGATR